MITPWMALVLLDTVTVATFARCFSGPGELAIVVPICLGAHLLAHLGRRVRREGRPGAGIALWILTVVLVAYVPLALVDGASFRLGFLPLTGTQHLLASQLHAGWLIFSNRVAPVSQASGLVLAAGWAAGVLALAAEALDADTTLPAIVALVPAFDVVVFTGTLGTSTGRAPELAALAALAVLVPRRHEPAPGKRTGRDGQAGGFCGAAGLRPRRHATASCQPAIAVCCRRLGTRRRHRRRRDRASRPRCDEHGVVGLARDRQRLHGERHRCARSPTRSRLDQPVRRRRRGGDR